jgi:succinyl-CoA synthetase beta subunit
MARLAGAGRGPPRGRPRADVDALLDIAERLGALMAARTDLQEIEINPILVRARGAGAVAVDALVTLTTTRRAA